MLFSTTIFLFLFLPIVIILYYNPITKNRTYRNMLLFFASIFFYAWGEPVYVLLMILSIFVNWFLGLLVDKYREDKKVKLVLTGAFLYNIGVLFIFKYLTFTLYNLGLLLNRDLMIVNIVLPIGISFYSFQAMSYVFDVYRQRGEVQKNPLNIGLYIALFPQLIAGPIVRYETVAEEINTRKENINDISEGVCRFIIGLAKKVIIANNVAVVADFSFNSSSGEISTAMAWLGIIAYTLQIYFDFSGYSDMAIGLGKVFGFHFMENFDYPYISKSISEFWRRWHISLGTWFRDYVYFPLGGSRVKTKSRLVFNLFIVWMFTGIWHGANWTFVLWGFMYFSLLTIEKLTGFAGKLKGFGHVYTLFFVMIGWVIFRANSLSEAIAYMKVMFGLNGSGFTDGSFSLYWHNYAFFIIAGLICAMPFKTWFADFLDKHSAKWSIVYVCSLTLFFLLTLSFMVTSSYNPFIYFNF